MFMRACSIGGRSPPVLQHIAAGAATNSFFEAIGFKFISTSNHCEGTAYKQSKSMISGILELYAKWPSIRADKLTFSTPGTSTGEMPPAPLMKPAQKRHWTTFQDTCVPLQHVASRLRHLQTTSDCRGAPAQGPLQGPLQSGTPNYQNTTAPLLPR